MWPRLLELHRLSFAVPPWGRGVNGQVIGGPGLYVACGLLSWGGLTQASHTSMSILILFRYAWLVLPLLPHVLDLAPVLILLL